MIIARRPAPPPPRWRGPIEPAADARCALDCISPAVFSRPTHPADLLGRPRPTYRAGGVVSYREILKFALRGLSANKLRSGLTTLGILIGVGAVILLVAVGNGSSHQIQQNIERLGSKSLTVTKSTTGRGPGGGLARLFGGGGGGGGTAGGGNGGAGNGGAGNGGAANGTGGATAGGQQQQQNTGPRVQAHDLT